MDTAIILYTIMLPKTNPKWQQFTKGSDTKTGNNIAKPTEIKDREEQF